MSFAIVSTFSRIGRFSSYRGLNFAVRASNSLSTASATATPPSPPFSHTSHSSTPTPSAAHSARTASSSASLSVRNRLRATTTGTPNFFTFRMWRRTFAAPRFTASTSALPSASFLTPPCILSARTVATTIAASGTRPAMRHLMSKNFSAPKSAPNPASVRTTSHSARASLVATTELQPWAMFPNGPQWMNAGPPSSVCTRLGLIASLSSSVMAPWAFRSLARTGCLSDVSPTMIRARRCSRSSIPAAGGSTLHAEDRSERRLADAVRGVLPDLSERLRHPDRHRGLPFARGRGVDPGDQHQSSCWLAARHGREPHLRLVLAVQLDLLVVEPQLGGDVGDRAQLGRLSDRDVGGYLGRRGHGCSRLEGRREPRSEEPARVVRGALADGFDRLSPGARGGLGHGPHEGRLVALPTMGHGSKIRAVRLDQQTVGRAGGETVGHRPVLESDHAAEGKVRRDRHPRLEHPRPRAERVQHDRRIRSPEHRHDVVVGLAGVHDDRLSNLAGERELSLEGATLRVPRRVVVMVIEPGFPERHHFG